MLWAPLDEARLAATPSEDASPEQASMTSDVQARVQAVLAELPPEDRALVALPFQQGATATDAAKLLGISAPGVRMRKKRLLARLRERLEGLWP